MKDAVRIGLLGLGTVGTGVARWLLEAGTGIGAASLPVTLARVAVREPAKPRAVDVSQETLGTDALALACDPEVDVVVELMGGLEPARSAVLGALEAGKGVVTANKALLAAHADELFAAEVAGGGRLQFEASVAGSIPIIRLLRQGLVADRIESVFGILNATTNYILTKMSDDGLTFDQALLQAQDAGYAEKPDPSLDVGGHDAAQKLGILARLAFGAALPEDAIYREGIERITPPDIRYARELGYAVKLLAIARRTPAGLEARVHPALVPDGTLLADIHDEFNAVEVVGDRVGKQVYYGKGAGESPTASAVVADIVELASSWSPEGIRRWPPASCPRGTDAALDLVPMEAVETEYFLRFTVVDRPGVLVQLASLLAREAISIASVIQHGRAEGENQAVPLMIVTHRAQEEAVQRAVAAIDQLEVVLEPTHVLRIERV
jgi:homoserine dehydrogenase